MTELNMEEVLSEAKGAMSAAAEIKSTVEELKGKYDALDTEKLEKAADEVSSALEASQKLQAQQKADAERMDKMEAALSRPGTKDDDSKEEEVKANEAFSEFLKKGAGAGQADFADFIERKGLELKALSVNSQPDGGYLVTPAFGGVIDTRVFESNPTRQLATVQTISTDALELVLDNDEAGSGWVGEEASRSETTTPTFDKKIIPTHELYAEPRATQKMLDDAGFGVEQWLSGKVAEKFARDEATAFISGNGIGKPTGILTNTTTSTSYDSVNVQVVNSGSSGAFTYAGLVDIQSSLKELYQGNATWMVKRASFGALLKIVDSNSRPIFNLTFDKNTGIATSILGRPLVFGDDIPAVAADANAAVYGDFRRGYTIVDRMGVRVLRDPYTSKPFVKFYTTKRVGGDVVNAEALKIQALTA